MSRYDAYQKTIKSTAAPRDVEYRLLGQVTAALMKAKEIREGARNSPTVMAEVMDALNWNNQVWDTFVEDVGTEGNLLPRELRAAIVSLGIWVTRETGLLASGDGDGDIDALISVNRAIMRGLNPERAAQDEGTATQPSGPPPDRPSLSIDSV